MTDTLERYFQSRAQYRQDIGAGHEFNENAFSGLKDVLASLKHEGFTISFNPTAYHDADLKDKPQTQMKLKIQKYNKWISFTAFSDRQDFSEQNSDRWKIGRPGSYGDGWAVPPSTVYPAATIATLPEVAERIGYWHESHNEYFAREEAAAAALAKQERPKSFVSHFIPR